MSNALGRMTPGTRADLPLDKTGETQIDGTRTTQAPKPTRAPLQDRLAVPGHASESGMERAMAAHADRVHRRGR